MENKCKHLSIVEQSIGAPLYKCDINDLEKCFGTIKDVYERKYSKSAIPNGECMFIRDTNNLSECPCYQAE